MEKDTVVNIIEKDRCTGCSACHDICSVNAIEMCEDEVGFLRPHIITDKCVNCGKCVDICPVINRIKENSTKPKIYAARANDNVRRNSSSGGVFSLLAEIIFEKGGCVFGAYFDEDMTLKHGIAYDEHTLEKMRGSKYVQSNMCDIYKAVRNKIKENEWVLFVGTPCQVAALNLFLKNIDTSRLITVDILCHGVPSQKMLKRYIKEKSSGKNTIDIQFRDKEFGWRADYIKIVFDDGTSYVENVHSDEYVKGFLKNVILRKCCHNCSFSDFPRQGDISIGDFWGIDTVDMGENDGKGTSIIVSNSEKGKELVEILKKKCLSFKEEDVEPLLLPNRFKALYKENPNRDRFMREFAKSESYCASVNKVLSVNDSKEKEQKIKYDVGLVSNFYAGNFGGSLTQLALYNFLRENGNTVLMIEHPEESSSKPITKTLEKIYLKNPYPKKDICKTYGTKWQMSELNDVCNTFVVGSDQLFQAELFRLLGEFTSLDWVDDNKKKIAYAASFGHKKLYIDRDVLKNMKYGISRFDSFSVREEDAIDICKQNFGIDVAWVMDPVFLCDKKVYEDLASNVKREHSEPYIASYILDPTREKRDIIKFVEEKRGLKAEVYSELGYSDEYIAPLEGLNVVQLKIEERLKSIMECDFFVTDSFHGTCFALIMGKPFISIVNTARGASRFYSIGHKLNVMDRIVESFDDVKQRYVQLKEMDYTKVTNRIRDEVDFSKKWLLEQLNRKTLDKITDRDYLRRILSLQSKKIDELEMKLQNVCNVARTDNIFNYVTDIYSYLNVLNNIKERVGIVISVKDTSGLLYNNSIDTYMKKIGNTYNLVGKHWRSYVMLSVNGVLLYEKMNDDGESIEYKQNIGLHCVEVFSSIFKHENTARIMIDGVDYAVNRRGLNIVVFDTQNFKVIDSVVFDTHATGIPCYHLSDDKKVK